MLLKMNTLSLLSDQTRALRIAHRDACRENPTPAEFAAAIRINSRNYLTGKKTLDEFFAIYYTLWNQIKALGLSKSVLSLLEVN
jgi:hypothetical protein